MSTKTPAERFKDAKVIRYEHGGGRVYVDEEGGGRELIADLYREDMRDFVISAVSAHEPLRDALKELCRAYVNMLESARDRIVAHGGDCDLVDVMERADPRLTAARELLAATATK